MSVAVILAAGAGRRLFRVAKAGLRTPDGRSYLEAIRDTAALAGVTECAVVVGPPHDRETRERAVSLGIPIIENPAAERGMAFSVACGFGHAIEQFDRHVCGLLWPVDHPFVSADSVRVVIERTRPRGVVIPTYKGRGGHPSAFGRDIWPALAACAHAAQGARSVIRGLPPGTIERIPLEDPGVIADVDTPEQLARTHRERALETS